MTPKAILLTALSAALAATPAPGNLLFDSDFESDPVGSAPFTDWGSFGPNVFIETDTDPQSGGTQALKLFQEFSGGPNFTGVTQDVLVTPGETYKLGGLIRNGAAGAIDPMGEGNSAFLKIEWYSDALGTALIYAIEDPLKAGVDANTPAGTWEPRELVDVAPAGTMLARVVCIHANPGNPNGGSSWFDDLDFDTTTDTVPADKPTNLLANAGFEADMTGVPTSVGWTGFSNNFVEPGGFRSQSLKLFQNFGGSDNASGAFQDIPVTVGTSYLLTGRARNGAAGGGDPLGAGNKALLKIEWLDAGDLFIPGEEVEDPVRGTIDSSATPGYWNELAVSGVAPAGAVKARVFILHAYEGMGFEGGSSWFDDLCFEEGSLPVLPEIKITRVLYDPFGEITVEFTSEGGGLYNLEKTLNLENPTWTAIDTGIAGTGGLVTGLDDDALDPGSFYRVVRTN